MSSYWKDKKVLVTGADGFIGSHLTERLAREGAQVRAFVYYNSFGKRGWLDETPKDLLESIEILPGDIRDVGRVEESVKDQQIVFHLASLIAIPYSYQAPESFVQTNIGGTLNVLKACHKAEIEKLVHTSTSEVYGTAQYVPIDEKHSLQGQSPYSASKIGADMMAMSFYRSFDLPICIVRPFNTYGPRQSARAVIPTIISQLLNGSKVIRLGALTPTRDFNFVDDTVGGFLACAESEKSIGTVINIGSGREISIGDLVKTLIKITGKKADVVHEKQRTRPKNSEVERLLCDFSFAKTLLGWEPRFTLDEGLTKTTEWIGSHRNSYKPELYNI